MGSVDEAVYDKAMERYERLENEFQANGGYAAEAEAAAIASNLGLKPNVLSQPIGTLSGGQRRSERESRTAVLERNGKRPNLSAGYSDRCSDQPREQRRPANEHARRGCRN